MMKTLAAFLTAAVLTEGLNTTMQAQEALVLVQDGKPVSTIVLAKAPAKAARLAAFELQHHLRLITGATVPIVHEGDPITGLAIWVGESEATRACGLKSVDFKPQEYLVRFLPDAVVLIGRDKEDRGNVVCDLEDPIKCAGLPSQWDEVGTLYAVYDFLERQAGVRWLNPTEFGTDYPVTKTLAVSGPEVRRSPRFIYRQSSWHPNPMMYDVLNGLWPNGCDGFKQFEAAARPELLRKYPVSGQFDQAKRNLNQLYLLRNRDGGESHLCNHSLGGYYHRFWEKSSVPNLAKLFVRREPDWFAKGYEGEPPQMCYTSRGLVEQVAQDARDYYDGKKTGFDLGIFWNPTLPNPFAVEAMDNSSYCKCPGCQAWLNKPKTANEPDYLGASQARSDYFFQFVNEVAKELTKTHPGKIVSTLSYGRLLPATFQLAPNVEVQLCFTANRMPYDRLNRVELGLLQQWHEEAKISGRPLFLWLYYTFPKEIADNGKWFAFPGFFAHTIGEQFKLFDQYGYRGMFHCGYGQEVEAYVTFKLMDDPTRDVDTLLDEYFRMYGPAAKPLKQLYLEIEATYCNPENYPQTDGKPYTGHQSKIIAWNHLGTEKRMARFAALMDEARTAVANADDIHKKRLELFEKSTWSYMTAGRDQFLKYKSAPIPSVRATRVPDAGGDPAKADWTKATPLGDRWFDRGGEQPSKRKLEGSICHDGTFLYLELCDTCDTTKLFSSPLVFCYDDWEVYVAAQRAEPFRQYAFGPGGLTVALSHGEVNWRRNVPIDGKGGMKVGSDVSAPNRWVGRVSWPLDEIVPGGLAAGKPLYLNIIRVTSPALTGAGIGIDTWVSYCTVHDVDRLAEIVLAQ